MRVTSTLLNRNYLEGLGMIAKNKFMSEKRAYTGQKFTRASEDPLQAAKAMKVRQALHDTEIYTQNLKTAMSIYETAESAIHPFSERIQDTYKTLVAAAHGTMTEDEDNIFASQLDNFAHEMVATMNLAFADRKIFGGVNDTTPAFAINSSRQVTYNGVPINTYQDPSLFPESWPSFSDIGTGMKLLDDGSGRVDPQTALQMTFNGSEILGCGVGYPLYSFRFETGAPGSKTHQIQNGAEYNLTLTYDGVKRDVSFKATKNDDYESMQEGIDRAFGSGNIMLVPIEGDDGTGSGLIKTGFTIQTKGELDEFSVTNANTAPGTAQLEFDKAYRYSNNLIQLILDAADCVRENGYGDVNGDKKFVARIADVIFKAQAPLSMAITRIGNMQQYVEFQQSRVENNKYSLKDQQNELECTPLEEEITRQKVLETSYNMSLQLSAKVIPMSIFNFI